MKRDEQAAKAAKLAGKRVTDGGGGPKQWLPGLQTRTTEAIARYLAQQEDFLSPPTNVNCVLLVFTKMDHQHIILTERRRVKVV